MHASLTVTAQAAHTHIHNNNNKKREKKTEEHKHSVISPSKWEHTTLYSNSPVTFKVNQGHPNQLEQLKPTEVQHQKLFTEVVNKNLREQRQPKSNCRIVNT